MASFSPEITSRERQFSCDVLRFEYSSPVLKNSVTTFTALLPKEGLALPILYYLSGLTCNDTNFPSKTCATQYLSQYPLAIVAPDTSPRGPLASNAPSAEDSYDFGTGAGFYVDATTKGFEAYQMHSFIKEELPKVVAEALGNRVDTSRAGIFGHSMGGHGALIFGLRYPEIYLSVSAFAPIVNPMDVPWGQKCLKGYLGDDENTMEVYDATRLVLAGKTVHSEILVDQGDEDEFLNTQLQPERFIEACKKTGQKVSGGCR